MLVFLSPFKLRKSSISAIRISMTQFLKTAPLVTKSKENTQSWYNGFNRLF